MGELRQSAESIDAFYASALGRAAQRMLSERIVALWPSLGGETVLVIGHGRHVMDLSGAPPRAMALVDLGCSGTPRAFDPFGRGNTALAADAERLPFADQAFTRVVALHALEEVENPHAFLREVWRVTAPEGRIMLVAANRSGLWSRTEKTPFGYGRPYSRRQLWQLAADTMFQPAAWAHALYVPPLNWRLVAGAAGAWERAGETFWPALGGVALVEAAKRLVIHPNAASDTPKRGLGAVVTSRPLPKPGQKAENQDSSGERD